MKSCKLINRFLVVLSFFGLYGCLDSDPPVWYFYNEPSLVVQSDNSGKLLQTSQIEATVRQMSDTIKTGDYLLATFIIDFNKNQPSSGYAVDSLISYEKLRVKDIRMVSGDLAEWYPEFTDSIVSAKLFTDYVNNMWCFEFQQKAPEGQRFDYELIYDKDSVDKKNGNIPILYLKSKRLNTSDAQSSTVISHFAFDCNEFVEPYRNQQEMEFVLKYKSGTQNGNDVYTTFSTNPIVWPLKFR